MGVLSDAPGTPSRRRGGDGQKFVDLYWSLDEEDRALIRKWRAERVPVFHIHRRVAAQFDIARSTVERGIDRLEAAEWEY